jgi:sporulation protein YabP
MEERKHSVSIENRNYLSTSGVKDIYNFDENKVVLETSLGTLTITGEGLHINKLNIDDGNLIIRGNISSCLYSESKDLREKGRGFLGKMFK